MHPLYDILTYKKIKAQHEKTLQYIINCNMQVKPFKRFSFGHLPASPLVCLH